MMTDAKALRASELLQRYCAERGCVDCIFRLLESGFCAIGAVHHPALIPVEELRKQVKPNSPEN